MTAVDGLPGPDLAVVAGSYAAYARAGVPRYWLLDVKAGRVEAQHADGRYGIVRVLAGGNGLELRPGVVVAVRELF